MRLAGAIDIGVTAIKIGIVDEDGTIIRRERVPTSLDGEPVALLDAIVASLRPMIDAAKGKENPVSGIGRWDGAWRRSDHRWTAAALHRRMRGRYWTHHRRPQRAALHVRRARLSRGNGQCGSIVGARGWSHGSRHHHECARRG